MLERIFLLRQHGTNVRTEVVAGVTTFATMAYILAVNPGILSASGMDFGKVFAATAITSAIATLVMGLVANLPFALSAGMGLNAFFAYTVCLSMGYSWQWALSAIFVEGIIATTIVGIPFGVTHYAGARTCRPRPISAISPSMKSSPAAGPYSTSASWCLPSCSWTCSTPWAR